MKKVGRPKGVKKMPKNKPNFNIKEIVLNLETPFGIQLKPFRIAKGYSLTEISEIIGCHVSNVSHFENGDTVVGNSIKTASNYAKALGVKQIKIKL